MRSFELGIDNVNLLENCFEEGPPPPACGAGNVTGAIQTKDDVIGSDGGNPYSWYNFRYGEAQAAGPSSSDWLTYAVIVDVGPEATGFHPGTEPGWLSGSEAAYWYGSAVVAEYSGRISYAWCRDGNQTSFAQRENWQPGAYGWNPAAYPTNHGSLVGVGMILKANFPDHVNRSYASGWDTPAGAPSPEINGYFVGRHQPTRCAFYYGEKFWDLSGSDIDEPGGPLG